MKLRRSSHSFIHLPYLGLEKSAVICNKDIHSGCDLMISSVERHRKVLLDNVQNMKNKRRKELELQLNNFKQINKNIIKSVGECQQIAISKDSNKYNKMKQIIDKNDNEQKIDINDFDATNIKLEINKDDKLFKSGMEQGLLVKFADNKLNIQRLKKVERVQFSQQMSTAGLTFSNSNKCVAISTAAHSNVLPDITAVNKGVACWRVKVEFSI